MEKENKQVMSLEQFIEENRQHMLVELGAIVHKLRNDMGIDPETYTEIGHTEPSIDVRLCVDLTPSRYRQTGWLFRTGSSDYDSYHSEYCAASVITTETDARELLNELINQLDEA